MNRLIKTFDELTVRELYGILKVRSDVFVVEQDCVYQDMDDLDFNSTHIWFENENSTITAYARIVPSEKRKKIVHLGRVLTKERGTGLGAELLAYCIDAAFGKLGAECIIIEAQSYAKGFYEREGFAVISNEFMLDGIPHVKMILEKADYYGKERKNK